MEHQTVALHYLPLQCPCYLGCGVCGDNPGSDPPINNFEHVKRKIIWNKTIGNTSDNK